MSSNFREKSNLINIFNSINKLKGIGPKFSEIIKKKIGSRILDIILYIPIKSIERFQNTSLKSAQHGDLITVEIEVIEIDIRPSFYKRKIPSRIISFGTNSEKNIRLDIVYYNMKSQYLNDLYKIKQRYIISGKFENNNGIGQITHPHYVYPIKYKNLVPKFDPHYKLFSGITKTILTKFIKASLSYLTNSKEWISAETIKNYNFISWKETIDRLHNPKNKDDLNDESVLLKRLAFDELIANYISIKILKEKIFILSEKNVFYEEYSLVQFIKKLPFELTNDQKKAINEISHDLIKKEPMMRLLQGDVGCGKTIVALCAMLKVFKTGYQSLIMAPTEVLAKQHFNTIKSFLIGEDIEPLLILGKGKIENQLLQKNLQKIKDGSSKIIIGTHALISKNIQFKNLKLAVVDEQQRFGVNQRIAVVEKGKNVNLLVMSATPIPRSLALTSYGDMSITNLKNKPIGRQRIKTSTISSKKIKKLYDGIQRQILKGSLIYWVCPTIDYSDDNNLISVEERYKKLKKQFKNIKISIAHGKQEIEERENSINDFRLGKSKILLATTVIEVGVDVPNADIIVIECSERYGLSQLHQLRGRVGRNNKKSNCILLFNDPVTGMAKQRLQTLRNIDDGFAIAEEDLLLRGPGEILGTKQSGMNSFKFVNFKYHSFLIEKAKKEAEILFSEKEKNKDKIKNLLDIYQCFDEFENLGG